MRNKSLIGAAACTLALLGMSTAPAFAQGLVEKGTDHANSICSFSGLNDVPDDPDEGGRVQSYGQIVRAGEKATMPSPGKACNGHLMPYPEAFGPEAP